MKYEMIREIFNECSNNQMRDVTVTQIETDDIDSYVEPFRHGKTVEEERIVEANGDVIYNLVVDGLRQRISFSED